jgi:purine-binding chemotaxis protein CheW
MKPSSASAPSASTAYLTFVLAGDEYAVDIGRVREVIDYQAPTPVASAAPAVLGVINLRGVVVPLIDLRLKFGLPETQAQKRRCVVVVEVELDGEATWLGVIADEARQVVDLDPGQLASAPEFGAPVKPEFLLGMAASGRKFILVLDITRVLSLSELQAAGAARAQAGARRGTTA